MGMQICANHSGKNVHFGESFWGSHGAVGHFKSSGQDFATDIDERLARGAGQIA